MTDATATSGPKKRGWTFWRVLLYLFFYAIAFMFLGIFGAGLIAFIVYDHVTQLGHPGELITVTIPKGATGREVGEVLAEAELVEYEGFFRFAAKLDGTMQPIQHGEYDLSKGWSASQLLARLYEGPDRYENMNQFKVTVPEGLALSQVAALFGDPAAFVVAASNADHRKRLGIAQPTLEGYLMPNTYFFDETPTASAVVDRMVSQFEREYAKLVAKIPDAEAYDIHAVVTIASLIEEEARVDDERALVAAVLYNRLEEGIALQMDSTLQYALKKYGQRMLNEDKNVDSPYNTYKYAGLPPGPISSPGAASLRAALEPAHVDYLFFVSNADGLTHTFSTTQREHEEAVRRYRREIGAQRRDAN